MMVKELGRTGVFLPEVGIGTGDYHAGPNPLRRGLQAGALFIDTAESYGTEGVVGEALKGLRDRVFVATKVSPENFRRARLQASVDASLHRLGIDTIDLLQLHQPNPAIPIQETMGALADLVDVGKVRFVGVSNFSVAQLEDARRALRKYSIVSNQVRYNLIDRTIEQGLLQYCQANHITVIAYSPLARGLHRLKDCDPAGVLDQLSRRIGKSPAQIALNWCLCKEGVVAIPKGNSEEHILDNCAASDWRLSAEQVDLLDAGIQYRHRGQFDAVLRRFMPHALRPVALRALLYLPRGLRRRVS
jgi:diketogulonate reductase-like aldo/keto reductase